MLLWLAQWLQDDISALRVVNYITFRAVMATLTAGLIGLFWGPWVIRRLTALKVGQAVRTDGPQTTTDEIPADNNPRYIYFFIFLSFY